MKLVFRKTIQNFFLLAFVLIATIFAFNNTHNALAENNGNQELVIRLNNGIS